jgi:hypothetical protein
VSDVVYSNQRETDFQIRIFETGNQCDIDHLTFSISDLVDEEGNTISRDVVAFTGKDETELPDYLPAGGGTSVIGQIDIPNDIPDGIYKGTISVTMEGTDINPGLYNFTDKFPVRIPGSFWVGESWSKNEVGKAVYGRITYHSPFTLVLDTTIPDAPYEFFVLEPDTTTPNIVTVQGAVYGSPLVCVLIDDVPTSLLPVGENGEFEASILLYQPGTYEFTARAVNFFGTYSEPTSSQEVVITGTGPNFSKDATLSDLRIGGQTITGFDPDVYEYDVTLPSGTTEVPEVEADSGDGKASISITRAGTVTGMAVIVVTAEDGITKRTYTVKFNVAAGNVATLRELKVNGINVSGFDPEVMAYTVTLPYGTTAVPVVTATATDTNATVTIIPADSVRGTAVIQVTSADGSAENTYTVNFIVAANNNANLSDLQVNGVTVYGFAPTTLNYDIVLPSGTTTIPIVTAVAADPDAEVKTTQADSLPGTATVVVTAADGITTRNYEIHFSVAANTDASLSDLRVGGETIEGFAPETLTYNVILPYGTTEVPEVTAITTDPNAEVEITQADDLPGTATVFVTAADGTTTKTYEINFSVAANTDASLSDLKVDGNTVEGFVPERLTYNVVLPSGTTIIPTVPAKL